MVCYTGKEESQQRFPKNSYCETSEWRIKGEYHRGNDLPALIKVRKDVEDIVTQYWYQCGRLHRDNNRPAVTEDGAGINWCKNGMNHRTDGPAVIFCTGEERWYIEGKRIKTPIS